MKDTQEIVLKARRMGIAIPAFNIPYLQMMEPVIRAVADQDSFALIEVARLEWIKFRAGSPEAVMAEFRRLSDPDHVRLHLDHVPVVDEDGRRVDYLTEIQRAISLGYQSVMVDGSRLELSENIACTSKVVGFAHAAGVPCEAELGAVLGHEQGPLPPYEELFSSGKGFTRVEEARRFVEETGCDWLSVSIGNVHGAISAAFRDSKKVEARLALDHLEKIAQATGVPLVLHGGSGVRRADLLAGMKKGIAKINVGTEIRQAYERGLRDAGGGEAASSAAGAGSAPVKAAQEAVFTRTVSLIRDEYGIAGIRKEILA